MATDTAGLPGSQSEHLDMFEVHRPGVDASFVDKNESIIMATFRFPEAT